MRSAKGVRDKLPRPPTTAEEAHRMACEMEPGVARSRMIGMSWGFGEGDPRDVAQEIVEEKSKARRRALLAGFNEAQEFSKRNR